MHSDRFNLVREKHFPNASALTDPHYASTLTDDHTLFLLNQQRELRAKVEKRSWIARLFAAFRRRV